MSEPDDKARFFATACRVTRAFLDGATTDWVCNRFDMTPEQVQESRDLIESAVRQHYSDDGEQIDDFESFCRKNVEDLIRLLITWAEMASRPVVHLADPEAETDTDGEKKGTSQGENTGNPDSP